jgi:hypothetical protein
MYYEEKLIDGVWMCRAHPDHEFTPVSAIRLAEIIAARDAEIARLREAFRISSTDEENRLRDKCQSIAEVIKDDAFACTFQSIGKYRTALLGHVAKPLAEPDTSSAAPKGE